MAKKDIFDLFREKSSELEQEPTPQAWNRIERRIQANRPKVRRARVRRLPSAFGIAAGLALVMGLSVVFIWLAEADQNQQQFLAQNEGPLQVEELVLSPVDDEVKEVVEIARANPQPTLSKPIVEGKSSQRLIAKNEANIAPIPMSPTRSDSTLGEMEERTGR